MNNKWIEWEKEGDEKLLDRTTYKTNRTFVGCPTETLEECNNLTNANYQNIVCTNRSNVSDMKPIKDAQKLFYVTGHKKN